MIKLIKNHMMTSRTSQSFDLGASEKGYKNRGRKDQRTDPFSVFLGRGRGTRDTNIIGLTSCRGHDYIRPASLRSRLWPLRTSIAVRAPDTAPVTGYENFR